MDIATHKGCGGAILRAEDHDGTDYIYCHECSAFSRDVDAELPTGRDYDANCVAWSNGADRSPDAVEGKPDA